MVEAATAQVRAFKHAVSVLSFHVLVPPPMLMFCSTKFLPHYIPVFLSQLFFFPSVSFSLPADSPAADAKLRSLLGSTPAPFFPVLFDHSQASYQGGESTPVILDLVITGRLGFVKDANKINVALTRERDGLIIVGDATAIKEAHRMSKKKRGLNS